MCGISGIIHLNDQKVQRNDIQSMIDKIVHRGPDGEGIWLNDSQKVGLGHRRLSIIDLSEGGAQPMHYLDRYTITFNGEIYNYIELRSALIKKGYQFRSQSDTEVILAAYDQWGDSCVQYFDGMFALAIWDEKTQSLFCARDRFGEKPFYYNFSMGKRFVFGSEMKCLFEVGISAEVNRKMLYRYLAHDVVENPEVQSETFYTKVSKLAAAHILKIDKFGRLTKKEYWKLDIENEDADITFDEAIEKFKHLFKSSVERRLRSDVPVGSSLSGGLDSSAIVLTIDELRKGQNQVQKTFSARFENEAFDEGKYMKMVVKDRDISPCYTWPDEQKLMQELDKVFYHQEEPFGTASIFAQWEVMKLAKKEQVTVLLDGQGADEILGGYLHYFNPFLREKFIQDKSVFQAEKASYEKLHNRSFRKNLHFKLEAKHPSFLRSVGKLKRSIAKPSYLDGFNNEFLEVIDQKDIPFQEEANDLNETLKYHCRSYGLEKLLRFSDRNAMAFSREVRLPFLSHELVEFVFTLPSNFKIHQGWTKWLLRNAMSDLLPEQITWRVDKLGFMPPQSNWMEHKSMIEKMNESKKLLQKEKIVDKFNDELNWRYLMSSYLFQ